MRSPEISAVYTDDEADAMRVRTLVARKKRSSLDKKLMMMYETCDTSLTGHCAVIAVFENDYDGSQLFRKLSFAPTTL